MTFVANAIKKVATGAHLSKDLTDQECFAATVEILQGEADPVQAAIFFIAMRMKGETAAENLGMLKALQSQTDQHQAKVAELIIVADPYNGFNRHCPVMAFLPAVLAAAGLPAISQGVNEMGPKFGVTHSQVLAAAGVANKLSVAEAAERINDPAIGWAYIDQAQASPGLYALQDLRSRMIKRPSLAALEKMVMPVTATDKTHLQLGFVHKAYPAVLSRLAAEVGFDTALIVRGLEGGVLPTLREPSNNFRMLQGDLVDYPVDPADFAIEQHTRGVSAVANETVTAKETVELALQALDGKSGATFDSLVLGGAMALYHVGHYPTPASAAEQVRKLLLNGQARQHFEQGKN